MVTLQLCSGDVVVHPVFGSGQVVSATASTVRVEFERVGIKQLVIALANLEVIAKSETTGEQQAEDDSVNQSTSEDSPAFSHSLSVTEIEEMKKKMEVEDEWLRQNMRGKQRFNNPYFPKRVD